MLEDSLNAEQRRILANVRAAAVRIWGRPLHRYYTDHTVAHTDRVTALLDGLTAGMLATDKRLAPTEVLILLAAAYLHDIGMQDERYGSLDEIRGDHHALSAELIYRAAEDPAQAVNLGLPDDPDLVETIALVAQGHRSMDLRAPDYDAFPLGGETVRPRLLAALLRFADALDIDHRRVDLEQMKLLNLPVDSQLHWWKCHYVSGVSIVDEYIRVAYRFPKTQPDYESFIVPLVESDIRTNLSDLEPIFRAYAVKAALGPSQVRWMRVVKPLPPEVETLAKEKGVGSRATQGQREESKKPETGNQKPEAGSKKSGAGSRKRTTGNIKPAMSDQEEQPEVTQITLLRVRLQRLDAVEIETLCLDYFPTVYDKFARGLQRGEMINLLLDHCRRNPEAAAQLADLLV